MHGQQSDALTSPPRHCTHRFGPYDLHDLVVLDQATVGVLVEISKDACKVLTNQGSVERPELRTCRLPDIKRKMITRNATTSDLGLNQVRRRSCGFWLGEARRREEVWTGVQLWQPREVLDRALCVD